MVQFGYLCSLVVIVQCNVIILSYLVVINLIAFVLYGIDKKRAIRNEHRIREGALLWIAVIFIIYNFSRVK